MRERCWLFTSLLGLSFSWESRNKFWHESQEKETIFDVKLIIVIMSEWRWSSIRSFMYGLVEAPTENSMTERENVFVKYHINLWIPRHYPLSTSIGRADILDKKGFGSTQKTSRPRNACLKCNREIFHARMIRWFICASREWKISFLLCSHDVAWCSRRLQRNFFSFTCRILFL